MEIVRWVSESLRPFQIVSDQGFQCLMKTGRPGYYLPSPSTVSRDVKVVFAKARNRIAKLLRVRIPCSFLILWLLSKLFRSAMVQLTLLLTRGRPPTTGHTLPSQLISRWTVIHLVFYWTWLKSHRHAHLYDSVLHLLTDDWLSVAFWSQPRYSIYKSVGRIWGQ